jgi:uncharacterized phage protein gp47/JayE
MAIRTLTQIVHDAIAYIKSVRPNIATFVGTVTRDVIIESPAQEFANTYTELDHTQQIQSIVYAANMSTDELDALAYNYGIVRNPGTQAQGTVTFRVRNYTTSSAVITIPLGTVIATQGTDTLPQVSFVTTQTLVFQPSFAPTYFKADSGFYEQTATIQSQNVGAASNVAAGTITVLVSGVSGVDSVINNISTTEGTDIESNTALGQRIQIKLSGNNIGTPNGITSLMRTNPSVTDAIIVGPNDSEMLRSQFGGEVDVYILGEVLSTATDVDIYSASGNQQYILQHEPARTVSSVTGLVLGTPTTFVQGIDYSFVTDPDILLLGSTKMGSYILWLPVAGGATHPDDNTNITIQYVYDSLIESLQLLLDDDGAHIVTSDILVKEANLATIGVTCDVTLFSGILFSDAISAVQTAVTNYINGLGLGDNIDRSNIIEVIQNVSSIDSVDVSTLILTKNAVPIPTAQQRLPITKTEYPRTGTVVVNVVG